MNINYSTKPNKHYNNLHHTRINLKKVHSITIKFKASWPNQKDFFKEKFKLSVNSKWKVKLQKNKLLGKQQKLQSQGLLISPSKNLDLCITQPRKRNKAAKNQKNLRSSRIRVQKISYLFLQSQSQKRVLLSSS